MRLYNGLVGALLKVLFGLTKLEVLLWAREELSYTLTQVLCKNEVLASVLVLPNKEAQDLNQVDEQGNLLYGEIHIFATLEVHQRFK